MNILDENIAAIQRQRLDSWRIRIRQIGFDTGRRGMPDEDIISFLQQQRRPTFFTRDEGFFNLGLCHTRYGLVYLAVERDEVAYFVRRLLHHPDFNVSVWRPHAEKAATLQWKPPG